MLASYLKKMETYLSITPDIFVDSRPIKFSLNLKSFIHLLIIFKAISTHYPTKLA